MIETYEDIQATLTVLGEPLVFEAGTIKGIADFTSVFTDVARQSNVQIETLEFEFLISTKEASVLEIVPQTTFTTTDNVYNYTYRVARDMLVFGTGWSKLPANRVTRELI